ncbi:MAG TPA: Uma2 family endonuclease [Burkholderiales bacterium]|nr:Uma2 family endonuclease [Burkholderiales bacterium]
MHEIVEAPLSGEELARRYRAMCEDPMYERVPGKIELDVWGRILMTPASFYHGVIQARLVRLLNAQLAGEGSVEAPVVTPAGLLVADVVWASRAFMSAHGGENPLPRAPEICIEVVSPSNSVKELREKTEAFLAVGAEEVWIVYPQSKRCEFHGADGPLQGSRYAVDLSGLFA